METSCGEWWCSGIPDTPAEISLVLKIFDLQILFFAEFVF
jgi:hypothetical protein